MDTTEIMDLALKLSGFPRVPPDSGIWVKGRNIRRALFAIDGGSSELLLAKEMGYDVLIVHHPVGPATLRFPQVVKRHFEFMVEKGVPKKAARIATNDLIDRLEVNAHPGNYLQSVEFAEIVGMPYMNIHLPIDQLTRDRLLSSIKKTRAQTVGGLVDRLSEIPEFKMAETRIMIRMGERDSPLGNWVLVFAAGTNGGYPVAKAYYENGIDTVIYLHIDYDALSKLRREGRGNLVVLGHMAGDSIGINIFVEALRKRGILVDTIGVVKRSN